MANLRPTDLNFGVVPADIMLTKQRELQLVINRGKDIEDFTDEERMEVIRTNVLALTAELHEAMDETGWKPWASSNHINTAAFHGELVDAWHFFLNLMLHSGMTAADLFKGYMTKWQINMDRQANGYDGITGKCPQCKRAYDDPAVRCQPPVLTEPGSDYIVDSPSWCEVASRPASCPGCKKYYGSGTTKCLPTDSGNLRWCHYEQSYYTHQGYPA